MTGWRRAAAALASAPVLLIAAVQVAALPASAAPATCPMGYPHRAEVVIEHSSGATLSACVGFSDASISAEDALTAAVRALGTTWQGQSFGGQGQAVCVIDNEPDPEPANCFGTSMYWAFFLSRGCGAWAYAQQGAGGEQLGDGDLAGFRYESQSGAHASPPGPAGHCPPPVPTPPATPRLATPAPQRAVTSAPSATQTPAVTQATASSTTADTPDTTPSATRPPVAAVAAAPAAPAPPRAATASPVAWSAAGTLVLALLAGGAVQAVRRRRA